MRSSAPRTRSSFVPTATLLVVVALVTPAAPLSGAHAEPNQRIRIRHGIDFESVRDTHGFAARYLAWRHWDPAVQTIDLVGYRRGKFVSNRTRRMQDRSLRRLGLDSCDAVQFDPAMPSNLVGLKQNYLHRSDRCFFVMYQGAGAAGYVANGSGRISLDHPTNRQIFLEHMELIFRQIVLPEQRRYLISVRRGQKRAWVYIWNVVPFVDVSRTFHEARQKYPLFLVGGLIAHSPPRPNDPPKVHANNMERLRRLDAVMPYTAYSPSRSAGKNYGRMIDRYLRMLRRWRRVIDEESPRTLLISTFTPAFDDHMLRGRTNPPRVPRRMKRVKRYLHELYHLRRRGIVDAGPLFVLDEPFEGMAVWRNRRHVMEEYEGAGLLKLLRGYFSGRLRQMGRGEP